MKRHFINASGAQGTSPAAHHAPSVTGNTSPSVQATIPLESVPPISMDRFTEQSGLSPVTLWRFRKKGWIKTCVIAGRHYLTAAQIAEFNARLASNEFAGDGPRTPSRQGIAA